MTIINKIVLGIVLIAGAGCSTGALAPIEDRSSRVMAAPSPPLNKVVTPAAVPVKPMVSADAPRVFALPDTSKAAPQPVPETNPVLQPLAPVLPPPTDPAIRELLAKSAQAQARGDNAAAGAIIERALKVKPEDPRAWYQLAEINFSTGDYEQSIVTAQRARALAGKDDALKSQINRLIDNAQQALQRH